MQQIAAGLYPYKIEHATPGSSLMPHLREGFSEKELLAITTRLETGTIGENSLGVIGRFIKAIGEADKSYCFSRRDGLRHSFVVMPTEFGKRVIVSTKKMLTDDAPEGWKIKTVFMFCLDKSGQVIDRDDSVKYAVQFAAPLSENPKKRQFVDRRVHFMQKFDGHAAFPESYGYIIRPSKKGQKVCVIQEKATLNLDQFEEIGELSVQRQFSFCRQLLQGFRKLNQEGIPHRAFNGGNMLIFKNGIVCDIKLSSFGVGCLQADFVYKNIEWLPPEQIVEPPVQHGLDGSVDIWTIGVVAARMIYGKALPLQKFLEPIRACGNDKEARSRWLGAYLARLNDIGKAPNKIKNIGSLMCACLQPKPNSRISFDRAEKCIDRMLAN